MEHEAKYAWIGAVSVLIVLALAGFIYWFALSNAPVATKAYDIIFTGTVSGLETGTDVRFNGIKVGQVETVAIDPVDPGKVIAHVRVKASTPVRTDTKALLEFQGLTGVGYVQLTGGKENAPQLLPPKGQAVASIVAGKSDYQSIIEGVRTTITGASTAFDRLNTFLSDNQDKASATLTNTQKFSAALAANSDQLKDSLASIAAAGKQIAPLASELEKLSNSLQVVVAAVPPDKVTKIVNDLSVFSDGLATDRPKLDKFVADASTAAANAASISDGLKQSAETLTSFTSQIDSKKLNASMLDFERFAAMLGDNSDNVASILKNTSAFTGSLDATGGKLDTLIASANGLVANADGLVSTNKPAIDKFVTDASTAAANAVAISDGLKQSAATLTAVTGQIDPAKLNASVLDFERFAAVLGDNSDNVASILKNTDTLTSSLNASSGKLDTLISNVDGMVTADRPAIDKFVIDAGAAAANIATISEGLKGPANVLSKASEGIDPQKVSAAVLDFERFAAVLGDNSDNVSLSLKNVADVSSSLKATIAEVDAVLANVNDVVTSERPGLDKLVANASSAAANVSALTENLKGPVDVLAKTAAGIDPDKVSGAVLDAERFAAVLGNNSENVSQTLENAAALSKSLTGSADKLDTILANVNGMVTSKEGKDLFTELAATSNSIRKLADNLNASVPQITAGVGKFTNSALPQYIGLAADARATLSRLDRVLSNIQRNPQSLVFGGSSVRTYNKR